MTGSLRSRQLISGFTIIVVGILILGVLLSLNIYQRKSKAIIDDIETTAHGLIGYLEYNFGIFKINDAYKEEADNFLNNEQLSQGDGQRFAYIWDVQRQRVIWSALNRGNPVQIDDDKKTYALFDFQAILDEPKPATYQLPKAERRLSRVVTGTGRKPEQFIVAAQTFSFRLDPKREEKQHYVFITGASLKDVDDEINNLIMVFAILFFVSVILILIAQLASSFWVVAPIREFEEEVREIETGNKETISNDYPDELVPIKNTINALIGHEKGQKLRYKDSLDDLAHSLKTPLAAIQSHLKSDNFHDIPPDHPGLAGIASEMEFMQEIISRQLRKAMVTTDNAIIMAQQIRPLLIRLANTMKKVHRDKDFEIRINVDEYAKCRMDNEDLMELFGNLLNNACKFCDKLVEISAYRDNDMLVIDIDDDGMGFPSENPSKLLKRGIREDSKTDGQGIGLAVSTEIVSAVNGRIELLVSPYVGARVRLHLPV